MKNPTQLDRIEDLLYALATGSDLVQWVTGWVAGQNEGGMMVALYGKGGEFPACKVYSEQFYKLPDYLVQQVPANAKELPANRNAAERAGRLVTCRPFQIARFRYGDGEKAKWRLVGVLRVARETESAPLAPTAVSQPTPTAPQLSAAELADSFFRRGDKVVVQGNQGTRPGVVTGLGEDGKVAVKVDGVIYRMSPDKLTATELT